ncbi:MAG: molybdopterin molybdotransferase MoeA, partial [Thaumarchaeota archaeon]|nr:molybdopterin molybdotransferase MoeA [Nitrososphaerota archaeon]
MKQFTHYTPISDAFRILEENVTMTPRPETVSLSEAFQRIIFADVIAKSDIPPFNASHMDGFAVSSGDLKNATDSKPARLRLKKGALLGRAPSRVLRRGEAYAIPTGGYLPKGADTVVPIERAHVEGGEVVVRQCLAPGSDVYPAGSDVSRGDLILSKGALLRAQEIGLLGSLHFGRVKVFRKPRVAIIATGSELTSQIENPAAGKIAETHSFVISRLVESSGGIAERVGIAKDQFADIKRRLRVALANCEIVLTMAGTSRGGSDITADCIDSLGKPGMLVHGVKVHRGRVMGFGAIRGKPIIILPGPIQGAVNAFVLFAYRLMMASLGRGYVEPARVYATLVSDWETKRGFEG